MLTLLFYFYGQKINMSMLTLVKCCSIGVWHLRNLLVQWYCCTHSRPLLNCTEFTASSGIQAEIEGYNCAFSDFLKWRLLSAVPFLSIQFCGTPLIHKIGKFKKKEQTSQLWLLNEHHLNYFHHIDLQSIKLIIYCHMRSLEGIKHQNGRHTTDQLHIFFLIKYKP